MGLFWSMRLESRESDGRAMFRKEGTASNRVSLEAEVDGRIVASTQLERIFLTAGTETRELRVDGHVGQLFIPAGRGPHRVVIVLGGSGGGFDVDKAAVLSRHGFATLALAYFGIPPLPTWLHRVPLEYFQAALDWLLRQPELDAERIGVLGVSRGGELALLLGANFSQIRAVVAYAPSHVAWAAGGREKTTGEIIPSWTWRGEPVPFVPLPLRGFMLRSFLRVKLLRKPVVFESLFRAGLRNREAIERAVIPVEQTRGPILLVSGGDDHLWPASDMCEMILARLRKHGFAHPVEHLHYAAAGHMLRYPYLPTTTRISRHPSLNVKLSFGGSAEADAEAQADSWRRSIAFFKTHL